jgi:hypothetical protein
MLSASVASFRIASEVLGLLTSITANFGALEVEGVVHVVV